MSQFSKVFAKKKGLTKPGKYQSQRALSHDGRSFQSGLERDLYMHLLWLQEQGEISDIKCQVQVSLSDAKIIYKPDFSYTNSQTKQTEYAEAKGFETPEWRIKRRLWMHYGPGKLTVYKGVKGKTLVATEVIDPPHQ